MCFECLNSASFCLKTRGFVSVFFNSNKEVLILGLSSFQGRILDWLTGLQISKGMLESLICFWILKAIDLIHFCRINSQIVDEKHSQMQDYRRLRLVSSQCTAV